MEVIKDDYISKLEVVRILQKAYAEGRIKAKDGCVSVLDDINALPAADVQSANQWISVKDRLPETGKNVLVYYPKWEGNEIRVAHLMYKRTMFSIDGIRISVENITHWQPLPEPPKDGDTNGLS